PTAPTLATDRTEKGPARGEDTRATHAGGAPGVLALLDAAGRPAHNPPDSGAPRLGRHTGHGESRPRIQPRVHAAAGPSRTSRAESAPRPCQLARPPPARPRPLTAPALTSSSTTRGRAVSRLRSFSSADLSS